MPAGSSRIKVDRVNGQLVAEPPGMPRMSGEAGKVNRPLRGVMLALQTIRRPAAPKSSAISISATRCSKCEDRSGRAQGNDDEGVLNVSVGLPERVLRIDETTEARLTEVMREHGWPGFDVAGLDGAASPILQHVSAETQSKVVPLVEQRFAQAG